MRSWTAIRPSSRSAFTRMECQPFPRTIFWRNGSDATLARDGATARTRRSSWNSYPPVAENRISTDLFSGHSIQHAASARQDTDSSRRPIASEKSSVPLDDS